MCLNPFKRENGFISLSGSDPPGSSRLDEEEFSFRDASNDMTGLLNPIQSNRSLQIDLIGNNARKSFFEVSYGPKLRSNDPEAENCK